LNKINIEDDFLPQKEFNEIQELLMTETKGFPWFYSDRIDSSETDENEFQFIHLFYFNNISQSQHASILIPILELLDPLSLFRIKANLLTRTSEIVENKLHSDMSILPEEKQKQWTTSIFYINTNNGYTKFENGTKVNSVANRMISFASNLQHTGTSCTDKRTRVVINFNYYGLFRDYKRGSISWV